MTDDAPIATRRGQALRGSSTAWAQRRLDAGLSISELAAASGVPRSTVGLIDQGRLIPSPDEAEAILRVLGEAAGKGV